MALFAVFKRDLKSYFTSPLGYVFIAAFLAVMNVFFYIYNVYAASASLATVFSFMVYTLIFVTPLLTMRLFSEEFKQKTDQLLLTSPVKVSSIVIGKFLSALAVFAIALGVTLVYVLIIASHGQPNVRELLANYIAIFCVAAAFISIGLFISSLTENQLIAALATMAIILAFVMTSALNSYIDSYLIRSVLNWVSIMERFVNFTYGIFDFNAIVYYASISFVFLFLTVRVYDKRRWN